MGSFEEKNQVIKRTTLAAELKKNGGGWNGSRLWERGRQKKVPTETKRSESLL